MLMTSILMSIMLMVSILMIGCTNQPPPIPMPPATSTPMVMVDERLMVMDALIQFNDTNNTFIRFLSVNGDIYQLEGESTYHVSYIASKQIMLGLEVYKDAIDSIFADDPLPNRIVAIENHYFKWRTPKNKNAAANHRGDG